MFTVDRQADGLHAVGEAWYDQTVYRGNFKDGIRKNRRGIWKSIGPVEILPEKIRFPYDLVFQNSIKGDFSKSCYHGDFFLHKENLTLLDADCFLKGHIKSHEIICQHEGSDKMHEENKLNSFSCELFALRVPKIDIKLRNKNEHWADWLKKQFDKLNARAKVEN